MDLSVSLCIAAAFAILCTFYIGKSILTIDFSEYSSKNSKKAKLKRLLAKKDTPLSDSKIRRDIRKAFERILIPLGKADQKLLPARMDMAFRKKIVSQINRLNRNKLCRKIYVTDVVPIPKNDFEAWNDDGREWRESVLMCSTLERFESTEDNKVQHEIYRKNSYLRILQSRHIRRTDQKEKKKSYYNDMLSITCPSCGAELICDETTAATSCPYCGNPTVIAGQFSGMQRPDLVLPFVLDKNAAKAALKKYYRGKRFLPNAFSSQNHIEEIKGVYVPFWLFDANASGSGQYEATTSSSHRNGDYVITTTRHYDVRRAGTTQFMGVPVDGSTKMPNGHMDAIEPYDYRAFQPFSTAYLPGYMADKYDEDADTCQARAHSRMRNSVSSELSASITGYNSVSTLSENISIDYTAKHYALLPVWMLHTKWQGKDYLFAMNGQTGKLVGDLPVDNRKVAAWFAGISVPLMILLAILL